MTVAALAASIDYIENGVTLGFAAPFRFLAGSIAVSRVLTDGTIILLVAGSDFTTSGGESDAGGTVTLSSSVAGAKLRIRRVTPRSQPMDYTPGDRFPAESHELALDRDMMIEQEQDDAIGDVTARALMVPYGETAPGVPSIADRAGRYLAFGAAGEIVPSTGTGADAGLRSDLALPTGPLLIGFPAYMQTYLASSSAVAARTALGLGTRNFGTLPPNTTSAVALDFSFAGDAGGATDFRGWIDKVTAAGANSIDQVVVRGIQLELTPSVGKTITRAFGQQSYGRLGINDLGLTNVGNVTSLRVFDTHVANEGVGTIGVATCYFADSVDLNDGTGSITQMAGFAAGNMGHATRVGRALGFTTGDMTAGASLTAAFHTQMAAGSNKFAFYAEGSAPSQFTSKVGIGSATSPTDVLEVYNGYSKFSQTTTFAGAGQWHEMRTANSTYITLFTNNHATTPEGIRIRFTAATPNNTSRRFFYCDDPGGDRLIIWSNGNVVNANNSYGAISDVKVKFDIRDAGSQIADICALRVRKFKLKADGPNARDQIGLVAQEVEEVSPGLVNVSDDMETYFEQAYERGGVGEPEVPLIGQGEWKDRPTGTVTKSVAYSLVNLKLLKAFQELAAIVDRQGMELAALKVQRARGSGI